MKRIELNYLLLLIVALCVFSTSAHDFEVDGIYYNINGNEATVTYKGSDASTSAYTGVVSIPSSVNYNGIIFSVTSIDHYAFYFCNGITRITIPETITSIGYYAFYGCEGISDITIPNTVTSIGSNAFTQTAWYNNQPDGVIYAGRIAYKYKGTMPTGTSIVLNEGTISISPFAFHDCKGLVSITIPNSVITIGASAFRGCSELNGVIIPDGVQEIGNYAFYGCSALADIVIPNTIQMLGGDVFEGTTWFNNQPDGVIYIGYIAYKYKGDMPNGSTIELNEGTTSISSGAFKGCSNLAHVIIPNTVSYIGSIAFYDCIALSEITIPESVTKIESGTFKGCSSLVSITLPNSISEIADAVWDGCRSLNSVNISDLNAWCEITFSNYDSNPINYAHHLFLNGHEIVNLVIPGSITTIKKYAFQGCSAFSSITIPNTVTSIDYRAFYGSSGINDVFSYISDPAMISMGNNVFYCYPNNYALRTLHVPYGSLEAYQEDSRWSDYFGNIVEMESVIAESISLDVDSAELVVGETMQLKATVLPENATDKTVEWTSSNHRVVTVDENGLVTAVVPGTANIIAITNDGSGISATCTVTVRAAVRMGDVNDDGRVDVDDVTALIGKVLGYNVAPFIAAAADLNDDRRLDIDDVAELINRILH